MPDGFEHANGRKPIVPCLFRQCRERGVFSTDEGDQCLFGLLRTTFIREQHGQRLDAAGSFQLGQASITAQRTENSESLKRLDNNGARRLDPPDRQRARREARVAHDGSTSAFVRIWMIAAFGSGR